jgi:hypothetical protein
MFKLLFSNRWLALVWGGLTLGSAAMIVGEDGAVDQIGETVQKVAEQQRELSTAQPITIEPEIEAPIAAPAFESSDIDSDGEVFINPETGQRVRIVRRAMSVEYGPSE